MTERERRIRGSPHLGLGAPVPCGCAPLPPPPRRLATVLLRRRRRVIRGPVTPALRAADKKFQYLGFNSSCSQLLTSNSSTFQSMTLGCELFQANGFQAFSLTFPFPLGVLWIAGVVKDFCRNTICTGFVPILSFGMQEM
jgi:hypothetical protein